MNPWQRLLARLAEDAIETLEDADLPVDPDQIAEVITKRLMSPENYADPVARLIFYSDVLTATTNTITARLTRERDALTSRM